jgi:hypothetical protein
MTTAAIVSIGNGLYARTRTRSSLLEQYRRLQAKCTHEKRDPRGTWYRCGHREAVSCRQECVQKSGGAL